MTASSPFHAGQVDWSGDNPGIYLRETADGPFVTLMVYFRIVVSDHGPGHMLLLFEAPSLAASLPKVANLCITDNEPLANYLIEGFCKKFGAFRGAAAFDALSVLPMTEKEERGDADSYRVRLWSGNLDVQLNWETLGKPFAADVTPEQSATGKHEMYSCFVEAREASILVDGRRLEGRPFPRDFMGRQASSAFLAFSETWVKASA